MEYTKKKKDEARHRKATFAFDSLWSCCCVGLEEAQIWHPEEGEGEEEDWSNGKNLYLESATRL